MSMKKVLVLVLALVLVGAVAAIAAGIAQAANPTIWPPIKSQNSGPMLAEHGTICPWCGNRVAENRPILPPFVG